MLDIKGEEENSNDSDNSSIDEVKKTSLENNKKNSHISNNNANSNATSNNKINDIKKESSNIGDDIFGDSFNIMDNDDDNDNNNNKTKNLNNNNNDSQVSNGHINNDENNQKENSFKEENSLNFDSIEENNKNKDNNNEDQNNKNLNNIDGNKDEKMNYNSDVNAYDENNKNLDNNEDVNTSTNDIKNIDNNENINRNENNSKMNISNNDIPQNNNQDNINYFDYNNKDNNENNISNNNNKNENIDKEIQDLNPNNNFYNIDNNKDSFELNLSQNSNNVKNSLPSINNMSQKEDKKNLSISNNEMDRNNDNDEKKSIKNSNLFNSNNEMNRKNENKSIKNSNLNISNNSINKTNENNENNENNNNISRENNSIYNSNNKINESNENNRNKSRKNTSSSKYNSNNEINENIKINEINDYNENKSKNNISLHSYNSNNKINKNNGKNSKENDTLYLEDKNRESKPKNNSKNSKNILPKDISTDINQKKLSISSSNISESSNSYINNINISNIRSTINSNQNDNGIKPKESNKSIVKRKSYITSKSSEEINDIKDEYYIKYIELQRKGLHKIINKNYASGFETFTECYELSQKNLNDKIKQINSLINMSISEYYKGNFNSSLSLIEKAKEIFSTVTLGKCHISVDSKNHLELKLLTNSSLANLSMNQYDKAISDIDKIKSIIMSLSDKKIDKKISFLKYVIYTLFKVDSLANVSIEKRPLDKSTENDPQKENDNLINNNSDINQKIMKDFLLALKYKNGNTLLLKSFFDNSSRYKNCNNLPGYYFCLFNKNLLLYDNILNNKDSKDKNNLKEIEEKLYKYYKYLFGEEILNKMDNKYKEIKQFVYEFNKKMECVRNIFKILASAESQLIKLVNSNKDNLKEKNEKCPSYLIKLLIKICLNYLIIERKNLERGSINNKYENENENIENINNINKLIKELERLIKKINNNEIDISSINIQKVNENILNNVKKIFMKISSIYNKLLVQYYYIKFKKTLKRKLNQKTEKVIDTFLDKNYGKISQEMKLIKINNKTKGYKYNYYNLDDNYSLIIKSSKNQLKPTYNYSLLKDVTKITYGIMTNNLVNKKMDKNNEPDIKNFFKTPWRFMSFITKKKSIDLYLEDEELENWFYGLKCFTKDNAVEYKLISTNKFVLTKIKLKIITKIKKLKKNIPEEEKDSKKSKFIRKLVKNKTIESCSFTKLFCFYYLINDDFDW